MSYRWAIAGWLILAAVSGCRNRAAQELLERDLRIQEDIIYDLEDQVKGLLAENDALRHFADVSGVSDSDVPSSSSSSRPANPRSSTPSREPVGPLDQMPFEPPKVELPKSGSVPSFEGPPAIVRPGDNFPEGELPPPQSSSSEQPNLIQARTASAPRVSDAGPRVAGPSNATARSEDVVSIALDEKITAGYDDDGKPGDDGVRVVVEPLTAAGQIIAAPAKISIVLMDPLLQGNSARIGRWDFTIEQVAQSYDKTDESEGMHLELPWYQVAPQHRELHMFVRYTTADGRKLDADRSIDVALRALEQRTLPAAKTTAPRGAAPAKGPYARPPATTQRNSWNRTPSPEARLLPPDFYPGPSPTLAPARSGEPTLAPPRDTRAAEVPSAGPPSDDRKRTGAKWSPYR